jgi:hypothetical protein
MIGTKATPSLAAAVRARLAALSLSGYSFNANGVCSPEPGATPQETGVRNSASAESASQANSGVISHLSFGESAESRFQIDFPGAMPQAGIKAAPLALNTCLHEERLARRIRQNGPAFVPQPRDYGLARAGKSAEKRK